MKDVMPAGSSDRSESCPAVSVPIADDWCIGGDVAVLRCVVGAWVPTEPVREVVHVTATCHPRYTWCRGRIRGPGRPSRQRGCQDSRCDCDAYKCLPHDVPELAPHLR